MSHPGATATDRHKVVIIGSGFGGLNAAQKLKHTDVDIKLIAKTTHHLFQPLLYQVATGIISEGEIAPPTRLILRKQENAQVLLGEVTHVDLTNKTVDSVLLGHTYRTPYDSLIIAAGAGQSYFGNDQFAEFAPGMKSIDDAMELRGVGIRHHDDLRDLLLWRHAAALEAVDAHVGVGAADVLDEIAERIGIVRKRVELRGGDRVLTRSTVRRDRDDVFDQAPPHTAHHGP